MFQRCREVQASPNGHLDLWAREHYKSTIITFGLTIQDILNDPEITFGIFSHTRPIAKAFMRQIMREFEGNELLKEWFPDILWQHPRKEAPKWSEDEGIIVKRKGNPKEATIEAWGLVDGQPTSKHYKRLVYDDVVTLESVTTPEMIEKVTNAWALSTNLGAAGGERRFIGTRYHFNDSYKSIMNRGAAEPRQYPATEDGTVEGQPVLLTADTLAKKRRDMGPYVFACQMLQDPVADEAQGFQAKWLQDWSPNDGDGLNKYVLVDPANEKKKKSDYTSAWVIGLSSDRNIYVLDMIRDRLNLEQRADLVFRLHRKWRPRLVAYEQYGIQSDVQHFELRMREENYRFNIEEVGGTMSKNDRIRRLIPWFSQGRIILPDVLHKTDYEGKVYDAPHVFIEEEYKAFPVGLHDDMLDALARIEDIDMTWPRPEEEYIPNDRYTDTSGQGSAWAA